MLSMATCISDFTIHRGLGKTNFDGISLRSSRRNWGPGQMSAGTVELRESVRNEGHGKVPHSRVLKRQCLRKGKEEEEERPSKSTVTIILIQRSNQEARLSLEGSKLILSY